MFNVGGGEILVIFLVALLVLGPQKLPEAAKQVGAMMRELKKVSSGFQEELRAAIDFTDDEAVEAAARARGDQLVAAEKAKKASDAARRAKATGSGTTDPGTSTAARAGMYGAPGARLSAAHAQPPEPPAHDDAAATHDPAHDDAAATHDPAVADADAMSDDHPAEREELAAAPDEAAAGEYLGDDDLGGHEEDDPDEDDVVLARTTDEDEDPPAQPAHPDVTQLARRAGGADDRS
jgi:Tat protein translocase TatB subunit